MKDTVKLSTTAEVSATSTASEADSYGEFLSNSKTSDSLKVINTGTIEPYVTLWGHGQMTHRGSRYLTPYLPLSRSRVNARRREMYRSPKVILAKMAKSCEAALDHAGEYASLNTNCVYQPKNDLTLEYICAFCNSKLFMFVYQQFFGSLRMAGGYFQFQAPQLRVIPIKVISEKAQAPFIKLVRSMVDKAGNGKSIENCSEIREIDQHFYKLYGLSEQEIELIERV